MPIKAVVFDAYGTLYDVQSVVSDTERAFPGKGALITQLWRLKQLEYTWLRSLMDAYVDFRAVTEQSLVYSLNCIGVTPERAQIDALMQSYLRLALYPDAKATLAALSGCRRAIFSNGSPDMLGALVRNSGIDTMLDAVISVDSGKTYKPARRIYDLVRTQLDIAPADVLFVSSNSWDACGAKSAGLRVAWIERVTASALAAELNASAEPGPAAMFKALRMRPEQLGVTPDHQVHGLSELIGIIANG
ncbi:MAG: haloacid dehalogenase type II [Rhizobiales bacterium]|nr:haloacid dehalogenase type II [Hyphomicrobiales bacterium]OJY46525.1 MAG: haloacid dehalogenase, type II [Rhizobiales bacterium 64-17]